MTSSISSLPQLQDEKKVMRISKDQDSKNYSGYCDSLTRIVEEYKQKFPEKYKFAQITGENIMSSDYLLTVGKDREGEELRAKELIRLLENGEIKVCDLRQDEVELLRNIKNDFVNN